MMPEKKKEDSLLFVNYHTCLPLIFSPAEERFILQMVSIELHKQKGLFVPRGRAAHMKQMQLTEYAFDKCISKLIKLRLLSKRNNKKCNRVYYYFDLQVYDQLLKILSLDIRRETLSEFCRINFIEKCRPIDSITKEELGNLCDDAEITP